MPDFKINLPTSLWRQREMPSAFESSKPGLVVILVDQSGSMNDSWPGSNEGSKAVIAATHVNDAIDKVLADSMGKDRVFIAVFGYSEMSGAPQFRPETEGWPRDLSDKSGDWLTPKANGGTPMSRAFDGVFDFMTQFFADPNLWEKFRRSVPPVIINITDGEADEFRGKGNELTDSIRRVQKFETPSGFPPLIFHNQIIHLREPAIFPTSDSGLEDFGRRLFKVTSKIPDSWITDLEQRPHEFPIPRHGAVGLVAGGSPNDLLDLLTIGTLGGAR
jgi:hypothetical protein